MSFFEIDGGSIYFVERGEGRPMVFVHGLACGHEDWRGQMDHFAPGHRVISLDQRGHGRSTGFSEGFDMLTLGADLAELIAEAGLESAILVGHSMGCRVVLECARVAPDAVAGLVLVDGSQLATAEPDAARRGARDAIRETGYDAFVERLFTQMFVSGSDPKVREAIVARARRMPEAIGASLVAEMVAWDAEYAERAWRAATVPITVIQSTHLNPQRERVPLAPGETTTFLERARKLAPHCEVAVVPGVGHFTMIEAPEAVNRHIESLLDRVP